MEELESGVVCVNELMPHISEAPFGGINHTGEGKEGGFGYGVGDFQVTKTCLIGTGV